MHETTCAEAPRLRSYHQTDRVSQLLRLEMSSCLASRYDTSRVLPSPERDSMSAFHLPIGGGQPPLDIVYSLGLGPFTCMYTMLTIQHCEVRRKSEEL